MFLAMHSLDAAKLPCPDQYAGDVLKSTGNYFYFSGDTFFRRNICDAHKSLHRLILILESPHKNEFDHQSKSPIGPANGNTGFRIRKHIDCALSLRQGGSVLDEERYALILMNAVQFQCSLGKDIELSRDNIFIELWGNGAKEDFCKRLQSYCRNSDVVVNCCTKGSKNLRALVKDAINNKCNLSNSVKLINRCHPASYHWQTGFEWV